MPIDFSVIDQVAANVFGEAASGYAAPMYTPAAGGSPFAIDGVFDADHVDIEMGEGAPISSRKPVIDLRLANFPSPVQPSQGDSIVLRGATYIVDDVQPNAKGGVRLYLKLASG